MFIISNVIQGFAMMLDQALRLYSLVLMVSVLISWVSPDPFNPIVQFLRSITDPLLSWIRRVVPFVVVGMIDLSPIAAFFLIQLLQMVLVRSLLDLAVRLR